MKHIRIASLGLAAVGVISILVASSASAVVPNITQGLDVSTTGGNPSAPAGGYTPSISQDGRYATWVSSANNLVTAPTNNNKGQVFVRDLKTSTTTMISKDVSGNPGDQSSIMPSISGNGRYIVYVSTASNLVSGYGLGNYLHIFLYDAKTGTTYLVDKDSSGTFQNHGRYATDPSVSDDGKYVMFKYRSISSGNLITTPTLSANVEYIMMKNMATGEVKLVNEGLSGTAPNASQTDKPHMSCSGDYVAFSSTANNLVSGTTGNLKHAYLKDMRTNAITNISASSDNGALVNSISCNGQNIGLSSNSTNLTSATIPNTYDQTYVYSRITGDYALLSQSSSGATGNASSRLAMASDNINYVAFGSSATNLTGSTITGHQVYFRNSGANTTELLSASSAGVPSNGNSQYPSISADGKYVSYFSSAYNIIDGYYYQNPANGQYNTVTYVTRTGVGYEF